MKFGISVFFSDVLNSIRGGRVLGVDIGTASIKVAEIGRRGGNLSLTNYGIVEMKEYLEAPNRAIQSGSLKIAEREATALLKLLLAEMRTKTKTALFSIPAFSVFVAPLDMPFLSSAETEKAVLFQARQLIPLPMSEVTLDWTKIGEFDSERGGRTQRLLLIGIPKEVVETYKRIARSAGLQAVALELESLALIRALAQSDGQVAALIDIGAEATNVVITDGGALKYSGQSEHGGLYLTQALKRSLEVNMIRAEELKRKRGLLGKGGEFELSALLLSFLDVIIEEVRNVRSVYERRYGKPVQKFAVVGGGANLKGLDGYFKEQLGLPPFHPSPFLGVAYEPGLQPVIGDLGNTFAVAVGLARRYFSQ